MQGLEFAISLFALLLFSRLELITPVAFYLKSDLRECCFKLRVKEAIRSSWKSDSLLLRVIRFKFVLFAMFFPFLCPKQINRSSLLFSLFLKNDICSRRFFKKSNESDSLSTLFTKRMKNAIRSLKSANCSFALLLLENKRFTRKTKERIPNSSFVEN